MRLPLNRSLRWYRSRGWTVGRALDAICALQAFETGDHVVLIDTLRSGFPSDIHDGVVVAIEPYFRPAKTKGAIASAFANAKYDSVARVVMDELLNDRDSRAASNFIIVRKNIFAWRRPIRSKANG